MGQGGNKNNVGIATHKVKLILHLTSQHMDP